MPAKFKNESTVYFFFLPLILGLLGAFFQFNKDFWKILGNTFFIRVTSFGIIFYTGAKPLNQEKEITQW